MQELRIVDAVSVRAPPSFEAIRIPPNCVFFAHRRAMDKSNARIEIEIANRLTVLPSGMSIPMLSIHRMAWSLAKAGIKGTG